MTQKSASAGARFLLSLIQQAASVTGGAAATFGLVGHAFGQAPIVQPGAPGQPSRQISVQEATDLAGIRFSAPDVQFMQGMLTHHAQALEMTALVEERTTRETMRLLAQRVALSQEDEIAMMQAWLRDHDLPISDPTAHGAHHADADGAGTDAGTEAAHAGGANNGDTDGYAGDADRTRTDGDSGLMPGMATPEQMQALARVEGPEFDTLFLELMIEHHRGALTMVDELLEQPGSAQDSVLYEFTADVTVDQSSEIQRMDAMLAGFSPDPRVALKPGFENAGEASLHMELVVSLPKPPGFFDPEHPAGRPMDRQPPGLENAPELADEIETRDRTGTRNRQGREADDDIEGTAAADGTAAATEGTETDDTAADNGTEATEAAATDEGTADDEQSEPRPSLLNFANTDLVFVGDVLVAGNYHGFNAYDITDARAPRLMSSVVCPGGQGDVSIVGNLLILSVEQTRGRLDCGLQGVADPTSGERFRGIRIFDVSDFSMPRQVGAVQTCRGSHTHTVVSDPDDEGNLYVYASGTGRVRPDDELEGCSDDSPFENPETALFRIDVIQIPVRNPAEARIVSRPYVFSDPETGVIAGLWEGGDHGPDTQKTNETDQCHDITAYPEIGLAAGACSGNGILLDISDPVNPVRVDEVIDTGFAYWHSATFNNDGTKVIFTDEWGGGSRPRCRASDPKTWGANAIYDIVDGKMQFRSYFKMPAPQTEQENCVAHNGSLVPVPGRDVFVQAWYQGGVSVIDFTDSANPVEIAFFDRGPVDEEDLILGGYWSAYWYGGLVYATEIARGLDVLALRPSDYLSESEIAAASLEEPDAAANPQQQRRQVWPAEPVVAQAYLDQLVRGDAIRAADAEALTAALDRAAERLASGTQFNGAAAAQLENLAATLEPAEEAGETTRGRYAALAEILSEIAGRLR